MHHPMVMRRIADRRIVYFPGSTIGNFTPDESSALLRRTAQLCGPGGALLLGADLHKNPKVIEAAYNDQRGITAQFNRNILVRINRELGADFMVKQFVHRAFYNLHDQRIEMHLLSLYDQSVRIDDIEFHFAENESIHTENSHKFTGLQLRQLVESGGFDFENMWTDELQLFAVLFATVPNGPILSGD
jgi:L-histidine Nalpha-methyltransferase